MQSASSLADDESVSTDGGPQPEGVTTSQTAPDLRKKNNVATLGSLENALSSALGTNIRTTKDEAATSGQALFHVGTPPLLSPRPMSESESDQVLFLACLTSQVYSFIKLYSVK